MAAVPVRGNFAEPAVEDLNNSSTARSKQSHSYRSFERSKRPETTSHGRRHSMQSNRVFSRRHVMAAALAVGSLAATIGGIAPAFAAPIEIRYFYRAPWRHRKPMPTG
jgi:hypothetical protein